jgi:CRISPR/Cas system-associated endonuclease Cas1
MKLDDMKAYIANGFGENTDAYEQVALLKAQQDRLDDEERHIKLRKEYVSIKIEYWKAYERKDDKRVQEMARQARQLAQDLKKV